MVVSLVSFIGTVSVLKMRLLNPRNERRMPGIMSERSEFEGLLRSLEINSLRQIAGQLPSDPRTLAGASMFISTIVRSSLGSDSESGMASWAFPLKNRILPTKQEQLRKLGIDHFPQTYVLCIFAGQHPRSQDVGISWLQGLETNMFFGCLQLGRSAISKDLHMDREACRPGSSPTHVYRQQYDIDRGLSACQYALFREMSLHRHVGILMSIHHTIRELF